MVTKAWYQSKIVWLGIVTTILGIVPILVELARSYNVDVVAVGTAIIGILTVIVRIWLTDTGINSTAAKEVKAEAEAKAAQK